MMKILIIGGTEFFGKNLVKKILKANHELTLLTRGNNKPHEFWSKISHIKCDRTNYENFKNKLSDLNFDVVIDNVVNDQKDIESIIDVFASRPNPPQYLVCSSAAVYSKNLSGYKILKEEDATFDLESGDDWKIDYANGKREAEKYLIGHHKEMPYTIFRPTVIEGAGDPHKRSWFWLQRIKDGKPIILSTIDSQTQYQHVSPEDVAQAFYLAVGNPKSYNQIYNVAGREILSIQEYLQSFANGLGKEHVPLCWIPDKRLKNEFPEYKLPPFFENIRLTLNIEKISHHLSYQPKNTADWIKEIIAGYLDEKELSQGYEFRDKEVQLANK